MTTDEGKQQDEARLRRAVRASRAAGSQRVKHVRADWSGESAAIYCRISHTNDDDQTGVDRQESICREVAERLGLTVAEDQVFVDNNRSAWQRKRQRPGWDALLAEARQGRIRHVLTYHPDRLMRQPRDLEELLQIADDHDITLHGQANRRDLADPDDRFFLRIEVAHACRSSDDTSRRLVDSMIDRAKEGRPHTGRRRYGYDKTGTPPAPSSLSTEDQAAIDADRQELDELKDMWQSQELTTREYREMRKTVEARIQALQQKMIVRPTAEVLDGLAGPDARASWAALQDAGNFERMNAVLRFLFAAVKIKEGAKRGRQFDYGRIDIEQNPIWT
jgi:DNA invertase Pin-like site-specific DNA recombinase